MRSLSLFQREIWFYCIFLLELAAMRIIYYISINLQKHVWKVASNICYLILLCPLLLYSLLLHYMIFLGTFNLYVDHCFKFILWRSWGYLQIYFLLSIVCSQYMMFKASGIPFPFLDFGCLWESTPIYNFISVSCYLKQRLIYHLI